MLGNLKVSLVVPTLNEEKGIERLFQLIPKSVDEVVVVDGPSTDATRRVAREHGARVVVEERPGYGRALRTGFERSGGDIIATADGDATYPVALIDSIAGRLADGGLDFVSCSRLPLEDPGSMDGRNLFGNRMMTLAASLLWMHRFRDILSGMWVFRKSVLDRLSIESDNWNISEEIKLRAFETLGPRFAEVHIPYYARLGETKLIPWKVGVENIVYMLRMRLGLAGRAGRK